MARGRVGRSIRRDMVVVWRCGFLLVGCSSRSFVPVLVVVSSREYYDQLGGEAVYMEEAGCSL